MTPSDNRADAKAEDRKTRLSAPHDRLFKALLQSPARARALLKIYLPEEIANQLSDEPPQLMDGSFIDPSFRASQSDRLFEVTLTTGQPAFLYALLEHKSTPDPMTPFQIEGYKLKIWRRYMDEHPEHRFKLPPIIPLVFYHGSRPWSVPLSLSEMIVDNDAIRTISRSQRYIVHHIRREDAEAFAAYPDIRAVILSLCLSQSNREQDDIRTLIEVFASLEDNSDLEELVFHYILRVVQPKRDLLEEALREAKPDRVEIVMGSFYEDVLSEGRAEGIAEGMIKGRAEGEAEGMIKGRAEGEAEAFLKLARFKYGSVSRDIATTVRQASQEDIDQWLKDLISAKDINDIFN